MFADAPRVTKNLASNLVKDLENFGGRVPKKLGDYSSNIVDAVRDLANTRLIYDGCNAGIRVGNGGLFQFYRNKYCNPPTAPSPSNNIFDELRNRNYCSARLVVSTTTVQDASTFQILNVLPGLDIFGEDAWQTGGVTSGLIPLDPYKWSETDRGTDPYAIYRDGKIYTGRIISLNMRPGAFSPDHPENYAGGQRNPDTYVFSRMPSFKVEYYSSGNCPLPLNEPTFEPPPPPPQKECCMSCCPDNSNIEALLKLIIKRIGEPTKVTIFDENLDRKGSQKADKTPQSLNDYFKLAVERVEIANRIMGIESFPVTVPDTMIEPFKEGIFAKVFKFIDGDKKRKINSLTEFIAWMSEQDAAVLGEFHQVIEYQTEDKKSANIVLPNVAEALKEIVLLTAQMAKQNNTQTELIFKIAAEVVAARAAATRASKISEDIQDYLDYPTQTKSASIPVSISLPKITTNKDGIPIATAETENHKNFLKAGEIKFTYDDWTGDNSLHDQLLDLLQLAAMLRAIYFQRTDNG